MPKKFSMAGYNYSNERQAAFDAVIGKLPEPRWRELPSSAQVLLAAVVVSRSPVKYAWHDGNLKDSFPKVVCSIIGGPRDPNWSATATNMGLVKYSEAGHGRDKQVRFLPENDDLRSVLEDLALYYQDPNALKPDEWKMIHYTVQRVCDDPQIDHRGALVAALGYALLAEVDACQP